ncbi:hypothetical protein P7K49_034403, partial [Saguinus oedipus]
PGFTATQPEVADWSDGVQVPSVPIQQFPTEDWSAQPATDDWSAAPTAQATEWVSLEGTGICGWSSEEGVGRGQAQEARDVFIGTQRVEGQLDEDRTPLWVQSHVENGLTE